MSPLWHPSVCVCVCACASIIVRPTMIPANCFSSILLGPCLQRSYASAALSRTLSLSLSLCNGLVPHSVRVLKISEVTFTRVSCPPRASSASFASAAGVAWLLCANSVLIQKLFYAVKRTCDRQRKGGWWGWGEGGGEGGNCLVTCPIGQIKTHFLSFCTWPTMRLINKFQHLWPDSLMN